MEKLIKHDCQQKPINSGTATTLELLNKWELPELCEVFKDQEISLRALKYLTEEEICELIPKIGLRTIFRAMLKKWKEEENLTETRKRPCDSAYSHSKPFPKIFPKKEESLPPIQKINPEKMQTISQTIKSETTSNISIQKPVALEEFVIKCELNTENSNDMYTLNDVLLVGPLSPTSSCHNELSQQSYETADADESEAMQQSELEVAHENEKFNVRELLLSSPEGKCIFDYYKKYSRLNMKNRKLVAKILMLDAANRQIKMRTPTYNDIIEQILDLFPNEEHDTYYIPRIRNQSAKGILHHRFSYQKRRFRQLNIY